MVSMSSPTRFLVVGALAIAVYATLPPGVVSSVLYCVIAVGAVASIPVGIRAHRKVSTHSWWIVASALSFWVVGDIAIAVMENSGGGVPLPSVADAAYVLGYLLIVVALLSVRSSGTPMLSPADGLEAAIMTAGVGLASWVVVSGPRGERVPDAGTWLGIFYTEIDVFLLVLLVFVVLKRRAGSTTHWLLGAATALMVVADYTSYVVVADGPAESTILNVCWLASYVLFGAAALRHDERPRVSTISRAQTGMARLTLLTSAVAMTPVVMSIELMRGTPVTRWGPAVVIAASIIVVLGAVRMTSFLTLLQRQSRALRLAADTDSVTGLANRGRLGRRLHEILGPEGRDGVALVLVDLNRFSDINQTFGYAVGDQVLTEIGRRLVDTVDSSATVGRLGGDEFALVLPGPVDRHDAVAVAIAAQRAVGAPLEVRDMKLTLESSVAVALSTDTPHPRSEELVQRAYAAVVAAKSRQPRLAVYDHTMDIDRIDQLRRMGELEDAITGGELEVFFQPRLDLRTGAVSGMEALLRWRHPREGLLLPAAFLPSAEQTGMLPAVTSFVIDTAMAACRRWRLAGLDIDVAVNLSVRDLVDSSLASRVRTALDDHGLPGHAVVFEVTESSAMTDPERSIATLEALRAQGVSLSIDDFGTGYSSLTYLASLPVQQLKMDRSFVTSLASDSANLAIVRSTIALAHSMGLHIVAEGVEDEHTLDVLRGLGCDAVQGFHIARPVPAGDVVRTVKAVNSAVGAARTAV
ncbi:hypothetical protein ASG69_16665 [Rhodococcus sp. Leaf225]|nr:hypothetical protein ASG69_16665 [Rhodococcus sp. Leaf225]KQU48527.1 hypothetical protein ASH03_01140 [Rhodococcus sp. Leaf258]